MCIGKSPGKYTASEIKSLDKEIKELGEKIMSTLRAENAKLRDALDACVYHLEYALMAEEDRGNKAASWFQSTGIIDETYICVDAVGRVCKKGKEFIRASNENAFPVRVYVTVPCARA